MEKINSFFDAVSRGDIEVVKAYLDAGQSVNDFDELGLAAIHYAVAHDKLEMAKLLVERGATMTQDRRGRWPSILAAQMRVSEDCIDFVCDEEAKVVFPSAPKLNF